MHPEASTDDFAHGRDLAISRRMRAARATGAAPMWSNAEPLSTTPIILENVESMLPPSQFAAENREHPPKASMLATGAIYGGAVAALLALIFVIMKLMHNKTYKY